MGISVFWTEFAEKRLEEIYNFYSTNASETVAKKIVLGIYLKTNELSYQPKIGQKEELLKNRKEKFRYLVYNNYKIIYWINEAEKQIEINDVFDARQNPTKVKKV